MRLLTICLLPLLVSGCGTLISKRGTDVHWYGQFTAGDAERFRQKLGPDTQRLIITSAGGDAKELMEVAHIVQQRGLTVEVKDYCASACAFLFLAAKERVLPDDAFLAFHASQEDVAFRNLAPEMLVQLSQGDAFTPKKIAQDLRQQREKLDHDLRDIFQHAGVQEDFYDKLVLLAGVIPGTVNIRPSSVVWTAEQTGEMTHVAAQFDWKSCGRKLWVPDQDGLARIGAELAKPYHRPDQDKIAQRLHLEPEQILFDRIDDLTSVKCKSSDEPQAPSSTH